MEEQKKLTKEELMVLGFLGLELPASNPAPKPGNFYCLLIEAMFHADLVNRAKFRLAFPELMDAVNSWKEGDLAIRAGASDE